MSDAVLERFFATYSRALSSRSKEIRLPIDDAGQLAASISVLLSRSSSLADEVIQLQRQTTTEQTSQPVAIKGGRFR